MRTTKILNSGGDAVRRMPGRPGSWVRAVPLAEAGAMVSRCDVLCAPDGARGVKIAAGFNSARNTAAGAFLGPTGASSGPRCAAAVLRTGLVRRGKGARMLRARAGDWASDWAGPGRGAAG